MTNEALQIYEELVAILPTEDELPEIHLDDPRLVEGVHLLCLKHGTTKMQAALDTLAASEERLHRGIAANFRRSLDSVIAVMGLKEEGSHANG